MTHVTVLYEDSPGGTIKNYGPHILALTCVADVLGNGASAWELQGRARPHALSGNGNVRRKLEDIATLLDYGHVAVLLDGDQVRRLFGLPAASCKTTVVAAARGLAGGRAFDLSLLEPAPAVDPRPRLRGNIEDVVAACCRALGRPAPSDPDPGERDRHLMAAANADRDKRERVLAEVPGFGRLVRALARRLG